MRTGLVSVSFRQLSTDEVIHLAKQNSLDVIEWGGDVHVPCGDIENASRVSSDMSNADLTTYAYGSYYRIGHSNPLDFDGIVKTANALDSNIIRAWAYIKSLPDIDAELYKKIVADARRICEIAKNKTICLECHNNTITEDYSSALKFISDVGCNNLKMYWQPNQYRSYEYNLTAAKQLASLCRGVHVFSWEGDNRFPLAHFENRWKSYIDIISSAADDIAYMLEFMHDDCPDSLSETVKTLNKLCGRH